MALKERIINIETRKLSDDKVRIGSVREMLYGSLPQDIQRTNILTEKLIHLSTPRQRLTSEITPTELERQIRTKAASVEITRPTETALRRPFQVVRTPMAKLIEDRFKDVESDPLKMWKDQLQQENKPLIKKQVNDVESRVQFAWWLKTGIALGTATLVFSPVAVAALGINTGVLVSIGNVLGNGYISLPALVRVSFQASEAIEEYKKGASFNEVFQKHASSAVIQYFLSSFYIANNFVPSAQIWDRNGAINQNISWLAVATVQSASGILTDISTKMLHNLSLEFRSKEQIHDQMIRRWAYAEYETQRQMNQILRNSPTKVSEMEPFSKAALGYKLKNAGWELSKVVGADALLNIASGNATLGFYQILMNGTFTQVLQRYILHMWKGIFSQQSDINGAMFADAGTVLENQAQMVGNLVWQTLIKPLVIKFILIDLLMIPTLLNIMIAKITKNRPITDLEPVEALRKGLSFVLREQLQWNVTWGQAAMYLFGNGAIQATVDITSAADWGKAWSSVQEKVTMENFQRTGDRMVDFLDDQLVNGKLGALKVTEFANKGLSWMMGLDLTNKDVRNLPEDIRAKMPENIRLTEDAEKILAGNRPFIDPTLADAQTILMTDKNDPAMLKELEGLKEQYNNIEEYRAEIHKADEATFLMEQMLLAEQNRVKDVENALSENDILKAAGFLPSDHYGNATSRSSVENQLNAHIRKVENLKTDLEAWKQNQKNARDNLDLLEKSLTFATGQWFHKITTLADKNKVDLNINQSPSNYTSAKIAVENLRNQYSKLPSETPQFAKGEKEIIRKNENGPIEKDVFVNMLDKDVKRLAEELEGIKNWLTLMSPADAQKYRELITTLEPKLDGRLRQIVKTGRLTLLDTHLSSKEQHNIKSMLKHFDADVKIGKQKLKDMGLEDYSECLSGKCDNNFASLSSVIGSQLLKKSSIKVTDNNVVVDAMTDGVQKGTLLYKTASNPATAFAVGTAATGMFMGNLLNNLHQSTGYALKQLQEWIPEIASIEASEGVNGSPYNSMWMMFLSMSCSSDPSAPNCSLLYPKGSSSGINLNMLMWEVLADTANVRFENTAEAKQYGNPLVESLKLLKDGKAVDLTTSTQLISSLSKPIAKSLMLGTTGSPTRMYHDRYITRVKMASARGEDTNFSSNEALGTLMDSVPNLNLVSQNFYSLEAMLKVSDTLFGLFDPTPAYDQAIWATTGFGTNVKFLYDVVKLPTNLGYNLGSTIYNSIYPWLNTDQKRSPLLFQTLDLGPEIASNVGNGYSQYSAQTEVDKNRRVTNLQGNFIRNAATGNTKLLDDIIFDTGSILLSPFLEDIRFAFSVANGYLSPLYRTRENGNNILVNTGSAIGSTVYAFGSGLANTAFTLGSDLRDLY